MYFYEQICHRSNVLLPCTSNSSLTNVYIADKTVVSEVILVPLTTQGILIYNIRPYRAPHWKKEEIDKQGSLSYLYICLYSGN